MSYLFCGGYLRFISCNLCLATFHTASCLRIRLNWPVLRAALVLIGDSSCTKPNICPEFIALIIIAHKFVHEFQGVKQYMKMKTEKKTTMISLAKNFLPSKFVYLYTVVRVDSNNERISNFDITCDILNSSIKCACGHKSPRNGMQCERWLFILEICTLLLALIYYNRLNSKSVVWSKVLSESMEKENHTAKNQSQIQFLSVLCNGWHRKMAIKQVNCIRCITAIFSN